MNGLDHNILQIISLTVILYNIKDMKTLDNYITERLKLTSKTSRYSCQPKSFNELRDILEKRLKEDKNADLNDIDVSKIINMGWKGFRANKGLFEDLDPHDIDISEWNVSKCTNMNSMFCSCENFNCDLSNWDVSNVTNMGIMFDGCENFTGKGLENWNVKNVVDMRVMFSGCTNFNCDLSNWDVSNVTNMEFMFYYCDNFNCDLSKWNVSKVTNMDFMFFHCPSLKKFPSWYNK